MKRFLAIPVLIAAFAIPATATGLEADAGSAAEAKRAPNFKISFEIVGTDVRKFKFSNLKMRCNQGIVYLDAKGFPSMGIVNDKFGGDFQGQAGGTVSVKGEVTNNGNRANGRVSADGRFPNTSPNGPNVFKGCKGAKRWETRAS